MSTITISAEGLSLTIVVLERLRHESGSAHDDWLSCQVNVIVPGFTGSLKCDLEHSALVKFHNQLVKIVENPGKEHSAHLSGRDPGIDILMDVNASGQVSVRYTFINWVGKLNPELSGAFETHQSYIPNLVREINQTLKMGPTLKPKTGPL
jgi:hypothetical protein